ncbi:hypothetical protein SCHPADRAFT_895416 [Schizopora paradoxa]|uniref:Uncharacterized protein n=1 Tax=Schizopora paradoxa TaxID=27342 RepID=A0A0H2R544_9AGAM|nr:hypothetical protein SCHPADRAFT_895416 [Schizopora paradoxa]
MLEYFLTREVDIFVIYDMFSSQFPDQSGKLKDNDCKEVLISGQKLSISTRYFNEFGCYHGSNARLKPKILVFVQERFCEFPNLFLSMSLALKEDMVHQPTYIISVLTKGSLFISGNLCLGVPGWVVFILARACVNDFNFSPRTPGGGFPIPGLLKGWCQVSMSDQLESDSFWVKPECSNFRSSLEIAKADGGCASSKRSRGQK